MQYIKAPDFPTGAHIYGIQGVKDAYETGRGRIIIRYKARSRVMRVMIRLLSPKFPME